MYTRYLLWLFAMSFLLTGCDTKQATNTAITAPIKRYTQTTLVEGQVSGEQGAIKTGLVQASTVTGKVIASSALSASNHYQLTIENGTPVPLVLRFIPASEDKLNTQELMTVVIHPTITQYAITPLSTQIAKKAEKLGGYSHATLVRAAESSLQMPDENKTSAGFRGDPTKQYGGWH